jgi:hypothetical protein
VICNFRVSGEVEVLMVFEKVTETFLRSCSPYYDGSYVRNQGHLSLSCVGISGEAQDL